MAIALTGTETGLQSTGPIAVLAPPGFGPAALRPEEDEEVEEGLLRVLEVEEADCCCFP
jgi:hypothetical protein